MELKPQRLSAQLAERLLPVYLLYGDEPLLIDEGAQLLRRHCAESGLTREASTLASSADFTGLVQQVQSPSLLSSGRLIDWLMEKPPRGATQSKALIAALDAITSPDTLLIRTAKLEKASLQSAWFKRVGALGATVRAWRVKPAEMPAWIVARGAARNLRFDRDAAQLLSELVEGNLYAVARELEKLSLRYAQNGERSITPKEVMAMAVDGARYTPWDLVDAGLAGKRSRCLVILRQLSGEGIQPSLILHALASDLRKLSLLIASGGQNFVAAGVWRSRQPQFAAALQRHDMAQVDALIVAAKKIDLEVKQGSSMVWESLERLFIQLLKD